MVSDKINHKAFRIHKALLHHVFLKAKLIREMVYFTIYQNYALALKEKKP